MSLEACSACGGNTRSTTRLVIPIGGFSIGSIGCDKTASCAISQTYRRSIAAIQDFVGRLCFRTYLGRPRAVLNFCCFSLSSVRHALVWSGVGVCVRVGGCVPKFSVRTSWVSGLGAILGWPRGLKYDVILVLGFCLAVFLRLVVSGAM